MTLPPPRDRTTLLCVLCVFAAVSASTVQRGAASSDPPPPPEAKRPARAAATHAENLAVWGALNAPEAIRIRQMPLSQLVETLSDRHKIRFTLDAAGLRRANVEPDVPMTADTKRIPIGTNLRQILANLGLTYRVTDGAVLITDGTFVANNQPAVQWGPAIPGSPVSQPGPAHLAPAAANWQPAGQFASEPRPKFNSDGRNLMLVELLFVKKACAPTPDQMRAIKQELNNCLRAAEAGTAPSTCQLLPPRIADCVAKHLTNEQATRYRAEFQKRGVHEREGCVYTVVVVLDDRLNLSEYQRNTLVASLTANWKPAWSQIVEMAVRNGTSAIPTLPESLLAPALDYEQLRKWRDLPKSDADPAALQFDGLRIGVLGTPDDRSVDISPDDGGP
jgi:hypothetical protein